MSKAIPKLAKKEHPMKAETPKPQSHESNLHSDNHVLLSSPRSIEACRR